MAQLNITLNQEEILQLLSENRDEAFKTLLQNCLNSVLKAESKDQLQAEPYERTNARTDSRNGFRNRELNTRIGKIILTIPRHRNQPFKTLIFDNYSRSESALIASMAEMVVNGVSTRKVSKVVETLCGTSISKSAVSELCKDLDQEVNTFKNRHIEGNYTFLTVDATYFKVRINNRVVSVALMIALGINEQGKREILGFSSYDSESKATWIDFLKSLKKRGLSDVMMITSDAHEGIISAIREVYPNVPWQRCQFHFLRNIIDKTPKKYQHGLADELQDMFNSKTINEARSKRNKIIENYSDVCEEAMNCLDNGFESSMTVFVLPRGIQKYVRTSNHIERLNKELKRRSKVIGIFPNVASLIRLMGSVLMEQNDLNQARRSVYSNTSYNALVNSDIITKLRLIAEEQKGLLSA